MVLAVILCTVLGIIGAALLVVAAKAFAVEEDPRIGQVTECLAGANCGGCGYAGCADYAKAVVTKGEACDKCAPGGAAATAAVSKIMGLDAGASNPKHAFVQCQGTAEHCKPKYEYSGIQTCAAANKLYSGPKSCKYACLGLGDCTRACKFDAIHVVNGVAHVDLSKCTGCGACKAACPKSVIMISDMAVEKQPVVLCSNQEMGKVAMKECSTCCIACGLCQRNCPAEAIKVIDLVARIDYSKCTGCGTCITKCPKKIIEIVK